MKNFKDITLSILAIIGFVTILSSFNNQSEPQVTHGTPESHVWELYKVKRSASLDRVYSLNKVTGEVRKYSSVGMANGKLKDQYYQVMSENKEGEK